MILMLILACSNLDRPTGIFDADRSGHFLNRPFPADELLDAEGRVDLTDFPKSESLLGMRFSEAWARQAGEAVYGFSPLAPIFMRFDGPLPLDALEGQFEGLESDPIRLFDVETGLHVPVDYRFVADALGDPYLAANTLALAPHPSSPLRSGATYIAEVSDEIARPPKDWIAPEGAHKDAAFATRFTVQDVQGELEALGRAVREALAADPSLLVPTEFKRLSSLTYSQGQSPSGENATVVSALFEDGSEALSYMGPIADLEVVVDLSEDPMAVYEAEIQTLAFRDLRTQPFTSPGYAFLNDFDRVDGRIPFSAGAKLAISPTPETMRIVVQVPVEGEDFSVITWDHGTAGQAYNAVQRANKEEDFGVLRAAWAEAGMVVVSRDQPLYGTRYPLVDEGFDTTLGVYNLNNLPAFRDNQRQGGVDHMVLTAFVRDELPKHMDVDPSRVGAFGHSMGSVTANLGLAMQAGEGASLSLLSGTGGLFSVYVTDTGLLSKGSGSTATLAQSLYGLLGADAPENPTGSTTFGALFGVPEAAWVNVDRLHPTLGLFQLIMDGSDPLAVAPYQDTDIHIIKGLDDWQVPNVTTDWLVEAIPGAEVRVCERSYFYDGHYCIFREEAGLEAFESLAEGL
jgi:S-formylglutathione hydrolase FrmB